MQLIPIKDIILKILIHNLRLLINPRLERQLALHLLQNLLLILLALHNTRAHQPLTRIPLPIILSLSLTNLDAISNDFLLSYGLNVDFSSSSNLATQL
jgi:hypothetical protein